MMEALMSRAARHAAAQRARAVHRVAEELSQRFVSADVDQSVGAVAANGPGLLRRWLNDPAARFLGMMR